MTARRIPLNDATDPQLRAFGRDVLGIQNLPSNCKIETLRAKITAAWDKDHITVFEDAGPVAEAEQQALAPAGQPRPVTANQTMPAPGKVRVTIAITEDAGGSEPVPVGVNGRVMLVPRDKPCDIPVAYYEVLKNAIQYKYDPLPDGKGINPEPRKVPLYPFSVLAFGPELPKDEQQAA